MHKIGFCLAGGGARGAYQIGIAKALDELKIFDRISAFSGTSIGSVNAAFLASVGVEKAELLWHSISDQDIKTTEGTFKRLIKEKLNIAETGVYDISALRNALWKHLKFAALRRKEVFVTLAKGGSGDESILGLLKSTYQHYVKKDPKVVYCQLKKQKREEIVEQIIASCSIPIVFPPVRLHDQKYYDGGVFDNVPVEPLIQCGCDTIFIGHLFHFDSVDKAKYPGIRFIEIRHGSSLGGVLNFSSDRVSALVAYGYLDTLEVIKKLDFVV